MINADNYKYSDFTGETIKVFIKYSQIKKILFNHNNQRHLRSNKILIKNIILK